MRFNVATGRGEVQFKSKSSEAEAEVIIVVISSKMSMEGEEQVFMGDSRSTPVIGKWKVLIKLTSGKVFALSNVLHVPDIRWNLVLILFDSDKIVLTKNDAFVGKSYYNQGLFMLNVYDIINNNASSSYAYIVDSSDV
ncbi:hypothetical protein AAG906_040754 [Vitis piasezkii]